MISPEIWKTQTHEFFKDFIFDLSLKISPVHVISNLQTQSYYDL